MANLYASNYRTDSNPARVTVTLSEASTVEGDLVIWDIGTAGYHVTLRNYDSGRASEYTGAQPVMIVRNSNDSSSTNSLVKDAAGNTLYTFANDNSTTNEYVALNLIDGSRTTTSWELA